VTLYLYKNQTDYANLACTYIYTRTESTLIFYVNGHLARLLLGSRKRANLWATIVFGIGDPRLENYRLDGLGMRLAGEQEPCQLRLGMKRAGEHGPCQTHLLLLCDNRTFPLQCPLPLVTSGQASETLVITN
jgi:hypothetical protein